MYWWCPGCHFGYSGIFPALMNDLVRLILQIHGVGWLQEWRFDLLSFDEISLRLEKCHLIFVCYSDVVVVSFHLLHEEEECFCFFFSFPCLVGILRGLRDQVYFPEVVRQVVRQLVYTMLITNNRASFHLW